MGVIYKLKDEVVDFIISQRQSNPLASCRQLAESASQKFSLHLSKSSVHDVLKESGIVTPRGRKPKDRFEIPQEKKKQIQDSLSQVKLIPYQAQEEKVKEIPEAVIPPVESEIKLIPDVAEPKDPEQSPPKEAIELPQKIDAGMPLEYEGAGKIFLKAALWDLGIFSEENIKATDWSYYLTYCKGVKVVLENDKSFFIDLPLPLERCIKEVVDGLINNVKPFIVRKVSDIELFKAGMEGQTGFKIMSIAIVDQNDHVLFEFSNIMELNRCFNIRNRIFVDNVEINMRERAKLIFFSQSLNNNEVIDNIMNLKGFDNVSNDDNVVTLLLDDSYDNKAIIQGAVERLNGMYLQDEQGRLVSVLLREA